MAPSNNSPEDMTKDYKSVVQDHLSNSEYIKYLESDTPRNALLTWLQSIQVVSAHRLTPTTSRIVYRFPVQHEYLNPAKTLQGGIMAAMYDVATTWCLSLIQKPGFWTRFGTSRQLSVTYLRPAMEGEWVEMDCELVNAGKRLCLMKADLRREKDKAIISTCEHQKYNVDADLAKA